MRIRLRKKQRKRQTERFKSAEKQACKGTSKSKDPWHVKKVLGHKSLKGTELYINIEQAIFNESDQEFHVCVASNLEEACKLWSRV